MIELRCRNKDCNSSSIEEKDGKYICQTCGREYIFAEVSKIASKNINTFVKIFIALIVVGFIISLSFNIKTNTSLNNYQNAIALKNSQKYEEAKQVFANLGDFLDSKAQIGICDKAIADNSNYAKALELMKSGNYSEAKVIFESLGDFNNCKSILEHYEENIYNEAVENKKQGLFDEAIAKFKYLESYLDEAIAKFKYLESYNDSAEQLNFCNELNSLRNAKVGGIVKFGKYEQDADEKNGKESIEWIVLDKKENKAFLLSKYGLENKSYDNSSGWESNWERSLIRKWLNEDFLNNAFNNKEQNNIFISRVLPDKNPVNNHLDQGKETLDKVFLLSIKEFNDYLNNKELDSARKCEPTNFVKNEKYYYNNKAWSLRTTAPSVKYEGIIFDSYRYCNSVIDQEGKIDNFCEFLSSEYLIRPAIWVNLDFVDNNSNNTLETANEKTENKKEDSEETRNEDTGNEKTPIAK